MDDLKYAIEKAQQQLISMRVHRLKDGPGTGGYKCLS